MKNCIENDSQVKNFNKSNDKSDFNTTDITMKLTTYQEFDITSKQPKYTFSIIATRVVSIQTLRPE